MSTRRSTYVFKNADDYNEAKDHLYSQMYSDSSSSDCIYFHGSWGWDTYRIDICSECSDPVLAASLIKEHGGAFMICKISLYIYHSLEKTFYQWAAKIITRKTSANIMNFLNQLQHDNIRRTSNS